MTKEGNETAVLAAGCFWGVQSYFDQIPGVVATTVGYTGGHVDEPSYEAVCTDTTGHAEAVLVEFDPAAVSFETLVRQLFMMHDPTQLNRQGPDVGSQYRSAIFYTDHPQHVTALRVIAELEKAGTFEHEIMTEVVPASKFFPAEEYHQKFVEKTGRGACHVPYRPLA
jgi:methionine-S-sulfoxide reductase